MEPVLIGVDEFCRMAGVKRTFTYGLMRDGELERVKLGRRTLISIVSANRYLANAPRTSVISQCDIRSA